MKRVAINKAEKPVMAAASLALALLSPERLFPAVGEGVDVEGDIDGALVVGLTVVGAVDGATLEPGADVLGADVDGPDVLGAVDGATLELGTTVAGAVVLGAVVGALVVGAGTTVLGATDDGASPATTTVR
jgi:hypothetical protein